MIINNGYSLLYYPNDNLIIIGLPQTMATVTTTFLPVMDRRTDVKEIDLTWLLSLTQTFFQMRQEGE